MLMSKTTLVLFLLLLIAVGIFAYITYGSPTNHTSKSLERSSETLPLTAETTLSLASNLTTVQAGQSITVAVLINNEGLQPTLAQLEIAYDPSVLTATSILPGTFFTHPTIPLQNISLDSGRVSYALKCPMQAETGVTECANAGATTVATLTFLVNPSAIKRQTTITFLPKTLVRIKNGTDILHKTNNLTLSVHGAVLPVGSSSGQIVPTIQ